MNEFSLTLFNVTLVQDSALSVSGLDRASVADRPFTIIDGRPVLSGRAVKGAAVAMARRFFDPLPRVVSEDPDRQSSLQRSVWECVTAVAGTAAPDLRAGVGILQQTGARAEGVLHDREVVPAGTRWDLSLRVDWTYARTADEAREAEGILGYVLDKHWRDGRCWIGGDVARGLGWCHIENVRVYRLDAAARQRWTDSGRETLPRPVAVPTVAPTKSWCLRTLDLDVTFGEYVPGDDGAWGLDMFAVAPHNADRGTQATGDGTWATPDWAQPTPTTFAMPLTIDTDRSIAMDRSIALEHGRPLLPGSSVRGPLRHELSRIARAANHQVTDPHTVAGAVGADDPVGRVFGTVTRSSRVLIRDATAESGWTAARLHMHAEDEFTAGSYGTSKRDAVRMLSGTFPIRIVVDGPDAATVDPLVADLDRLIALGRLGHLPIGADKTRGSGWGRWVPGEWHDHGEPEPERSWTPPDDSPPRRRPRERRGDSGASVWKDYRENDNEIVRLVTSTGSIEEDLTLAGAAELARATSEDMKLVAWWCEPSIDLDIASAPQVFGEDWPTSTIGVDEVSFFFAGAVWRAVRTAAGARWVLHRETAEGSPMELVRTPVRLHGDRTRFAAFGSSTKRYVVRGWRADGIVRGYTLEPAGRP